MRRHYFALIVLLLAVSCHRIHCLERFEAQNIQLFYEISQNGEVTKKLTSHATKKVKAKRNT